MLVTTEVKLDHIILHKVGNKSRNEVIQFSKKPLDLNDTVKDLLQRYFLSPFKSEAYSNLFHESDINLNEVFAFVSRILDSPSGIMEQSENLARHLYEQSTHPNVKSGEFYVTYMRDLVLDGEALEAVGLFKSESRETYLKVYPNGETFDIDSEDGVNINKLDKGCLILNKDREHGFVVLTVDNLNKREEAIYWKDDFLKVKSRQDAYHHTQNIMSLCKNFVEKRLPEEFEVSRGEQADLLNKSVKFLKEKEIFDLQEFQNEVIAQPDLIQSFKSYKTEFESNRGFEIIPEFDIHENAFKKNTRFMKSVIKLDKNFHIYVHGNSENMQKGYDEERAQHFYQLFYKAES
ncbi:hypothetical protein AHMF7605_00675 [Adhaeribacter arboris]|uniref:Nucleoid-associated protein n=1 Tax=Adhaeribacter arboris TaxID=2072846 RepID=A0A2T2Y9E0_9BACT|nr:nucleoid-associated protein [Adhaeribacter arboris]PSR52139.1 hypothetical protein AHMF7605_00675 [Adhaeribacter arboris]